jgi:tetratricopeptide (TPR) repeat protein
MSVLEIFNKWISIDNSQEAFAFLIEHPVLLSPTHWPELEHWIQRLPDDQQERPRRLFSTLANLHSKISADFGIYPLGDGPIEKIWKRHDAGEVSLDHACELARVPEVYSLLSPLYVSILSQNSERYAQVKDWRMPVALHKVLLAALEARPADEDQPMMWSSAVLSWLEIVTRALVDVPDRRLFNSALTLGEALAKEGDDHPGHPAPAEILHRLGVLHLDSYFAGRSSVDYLSQHIMWQERLNREYGQEIIGLHEEKIRMSPPEKALKTAVEYLRRAASKRKSTYKARSLKALAEALMWSEIIGQEVDNEEICRVATEALELFNPEEYAQERAALIALLNKATEGKTTAGKASSEVERLLNEPLDSIVAELGSAVTVELFLQTASTLQTNAPQTALELCQRINDLVISQGNEQLVETYFKQVMRLISLALADETARQPENRSFQEIASSMAERAEREKWSSRKLAASLISLAAWGSQYDQEDEALIILDKALKIDPEFITDYHDFIGWLQTSLIVGTAVNAFNSGDLKKSVERYFLALGVYLTIQMSTNAQNMMRRILDIAENADADVAAQIVIGLASQAPRLEAKIGGEATQLIQQTCRRTMAQLLSIGNVKSILILYLLQVAKGLNFSIALDRDKRIHWQDDPESRELLERIADATAQIEAKSPGNQKEYLLDKEWLLIAYTGMGERHGGETKAEVLENLQHQFDANLSRRLMGGTEPIIKKLLKPEEIQEILDKETILINYYIGASPKGEATLYIFLITREEMYLRAGVAGLPSGVVQMSDHDRKISINFLAFTASSVREKILEEPGPRVVSSSAVNLLAGEGANYFGGDLKDILAKLKAAGKSHLCIVPHGPLHFYPFHLLGPEDAPLAEEWIVTYLPNLRMLDTRRQSHRESQRQFGDSRKQPRALTAFGLGFEPGNPHGLDPLEGAAEEAQLIAQLFDAEAIIDDNATKSAFLEALENSRMVHLATHGDHNVVAPAFQCVYLAPDKKSDGILYSYEILGLDLTGLELVTLSACETALGRFDAGDNIRGFPASLILAGVSTIVGTLWEVETNTSVLFFTTFYEHLRAGASKLNAFYESQRKTRDSHPEYRDWGAFYFIGDWS